MFGGKFPILSELLQDKNIVDIMKPCTILIDMLINHLNNLYEEWKTRLRLKSFEDTSASSFISNSKVMASIQNLINKAANSEIVVSINGATGTGKEVVARRIHNLSPRVRMPFVAVNVAAIPSDLVESAFFGHEKGAFTGAVSRKIGYFEEASGGTLFLDEIGDMDLKMQAKLLRALQEGVITRVGGNGEIKINTRIITATHRNLRTLISEGLFREDLYFRLMGLSINLPRLCERGEDILLLADYFIRDYCLRSKKGRCVLSEEAMKIINEYEFPGNVRELKAMMELAVILCNDDVIMPEDLNLQLPTQEANFLDREHTLQEYEERIILHYLEKYGNRVKEVAERLDISKTKIYNLIQGNKSGK